MSALRVKLEGAERFKSINRGQHFSCPSKIRTWNPSGLTSAWLHFPMKHDAFMLLQITILLYYFHDATFRSTFGTFFLPAIEQLHLIFMEVPLSALILSDVSIQKDRLSSLL